MKILLVDDQFITRALVKALLNEYGDCDVTQTGIEAIKLFEVALNSDSPYDLICLDIIMPEMDGLETLRKIRQIEEDHKLFGSDMTNVIIITSVDEKEVVMDAFKSGCEAYIVKPVCRERLFEQLDSLGYKPRIQA